MYFRNYRLWTTFSDHSVKRAILDHALTVKMWKCPKYLWNLHGGSFIMFLIILRENDSEMSPLVFRKILSLFVNI